MVASEVKELARQSATSADDIKGKIEQIQGSTERATAEILSVCDVISEVGGLIVSIAAAIEEQASVTKGVSENIAQASSGVRDTNERIAQTAIVSKSIATDMAAVNVSVGEVRRGGEQVSETTVELSKMAERLRATAERFKF